MLRLMAWLSPAFPTGAFAYSHGLEWAVESGDVCNETSLAAWLTDIVTVGTGRSDTILLRHSHRAAAEPAALREIADLAYASGCQPRTAKRIARSGEGVHACRRRMGASGCARAHTVSGRDRGVAGAHRISENTTAAAFLQAFTSNLISAAVRLVPLGQTAGLRVLAALKSTILRTSEETKKATLDDLGGCTFRSDLAAMRHETQYTRLFRS